MILKYLSVCLKIEVSFELKSSHQLSIRGLAYFAVALTY
jgi:hypothetical protein